MSMTRTGTLEQVERARSLFAAEPQGTWLTANPHTIANVQFAFIQFVRYGEEDTMRKMIAQYYRPEYVAGIVGNLLRLARSATAS